MALESDYLEELSEHLVPQPHTLAKFEDCLQKLETIVTQLEKGDVPLENALKLFEEGIQLSNSCRKELEEAEGKVEILLKQNGKLQAEPFDRIPDVKM